jgi:cobalt transporter subunit CbtA
MLALMFRRIVFTACLVGLLTGIVVTGLQLFVTVPVILEAETYEGGGADAAGHAEAHAAEAAPGDRMTESGGVLSRLYQGVHAFQHAESDWEPEDGLQRNGYTLIANVLIAIGFGLLLGAAFSLRRSVSWTEGLLWGLGGYANFFVLPALGLPPEIPGTFAADLVPRQGWWLSTVLCSGVGLALVALQKQWLWKIVGAVLVVVPHILGAPHPEVHGGTAPEVLADAFILRTAFVNALFWLLLGSLTARPFKKLG